MSALNLKIPPPVVLLIVAALMWAVARYLYPGQPTTLHLVACAVAIVLGAAVLVTAYFTFRRARTTLDPQHPEQATTLLTHGIYRFSRNPIYLAMALILFGWAFYLASPPVFVLPFVFVGYMTRFQIIPEENALAAAFGDEFALYRANTRRWL